MVKNERKIFFWRPTAANVQQLIKLENLSSVEVATLDDLTTAVFNAVKNKNGKEAIILTNNLLEKYTSALHARHHLPLMVLSPVSRPDFTKNNQLDISQLPQSRFFNALAIQDEPMQGVLASPSLTDYDGSALRGRDLRAIVYSWQDLLEGARLLAYSKVMPSASIKYRDQKPNYPNVGFTVPSRTKNERRYKVVWTSMPFDYGGKLTINSTAFDIQSAYAMRPFEGSEERRAYSPRNIGVKPYEVINNALPVMWNDFGALFWHMNQRMDIYRAQKEEKKTVFLPQIVKLNPFPIPTQEAVDVYKILTNSVIYSPDEKHFSHLPEAAVNLAFGSYIINHKDTAFVRPSYVQGYVKGQQVTKLDSLEWSSPIALMAKEFRDKK